MVRLDAEYRWGFRYGRMFRENARVVVSSELEAQHFIDYADFPKENLYVTGLAQWDRVKYNSLSKDADSIMILPTWRHWELTEARINPENTGYYKLMERIVKNIPKEYEDKIMLVPHPLFIEYFKDTELGKYLPKDYKNWIGLLDRTKLFITDYSSFSYFAFYKGCNVIFDWSDLDECMRIGYNGALMLNKDNVFGDIVYNESKDLEGLIKENMLEDRKKRYIDNYSKIVEFKDGHNADRIVTKLKEDGFLK
jgi:CDP-glycerol glycerophosphotransferase (TagB/SpsB family)